MNIKSKISYALVLIFGVVFTMHASKHECKVAEGQENPLHQIVRQNNEFLFSWFQHNHPQFIVQCVLVRDSKQESPLSLVVKKLETYRALSGKEREAVWDFMQTTKYFYDILSDAAMVKLSASAHDNKLKAYADSLFKRGGKSHTKTLQKSLCVNSNDVLSNLEHLYITPPDHDSDHSDSGSARRDSESDESMSSGEE